MCSSDCVLREHNIEDLHWIFNNPKKYSFSPDWNNALERVKCVIKKWKEFIDSDESKYYVYKSDNFPHKKNEKPTDRASAFKRFISVVKKHKMPNDFQEFSCLEGDFWLGRPILVHGAIPGVNCINVPTTYLICEINKDDWKSYLVALEIVQETIEYVLKEKSKERRKYKLHWSG